MKTTLLSVALFFLTFQSIIAQSLLPSIGQFTQPMDTSEICYYPVTIDSTGFCLPGPEVGDTMPDFTLYDMANNAFTLSNNLVPGKYTLLISGSYTCPVFRNKVPIINSVVTSYAADVDTYVVYQMEAHPATDTSLYFGYVNPGAANTSQGILYDQPTTYGERKMLIDTMNADLTILAPILIDGPCNEFLDYFGPAPNNAYLIDSNGIIVLKHCWFDKFPISIVNDLDSVLFGSTSGSNGTNGTFTFALDGNDSVAYGNPGDILTLGGTFTNTDLVDDVIIELTRVSNNLPDPSWTSAMCLNVCLGTNVSNYTLQIPPNSTKHFSFYFFTGSSASGDAQFEFVNTNAPGNFVTQGFYGNTTGLGTKESINGQLISIYPNPTNGLITVIGNSEDLAYTRFYTALGQDVTELTDVTSVTGNNKTFDLSRLTSGLYLIKTRKATTRIYKLH